MSLGHPVKWIHLRDCEIPVDEKIAYLVILMNRAGFDTSESCQDVEPPQNAEGGGPWVRIGMLDLFGLQAWTRFAEGVGANTGEWDFQVWSEGGILASSALFPFFEVPLLEGRLRRLMR